MKKVITVLAILVVLTSAIFAAEAAGSTNIIRIKSTVLRQDPTFSLKATNSGSSTVEAADGETTDLVVAEDISQSDITVTFGIYQTAAAKNRFVYSFQVGVTELKKVNQSGAVITGDGAYTVETGVLMADPDNTNWYDDANDGIGDATAPSVTDNVLSGTVEFDGEAVVDADDDAKTTFNVTWTSDREAPAGDYMADITMTVTVR